MKIKIDNAGTVNLEREKWQSLIFATIFLIAGLIRSIDVWRPIDGTVGESWREPDVAGIARNFYREDMNILYPRIDWRGDGTGYVESEFPLYAWSVACLYHLFGYHEELPRVLSYFMSLASCLIFFRLALVLLHFSGAIAASTVFAFNPLAFKMASAVQAEPLMFLAYLATVYWFIQWCNQESKIYYWGAMMAATLAILAKLSALHVGILLAAIAVERFGWKAWRRKDLWLFASVVLLVSFLWYAHARNLWLAYGNSLGMSNEAYLRMGVSNMLRAFPAMILGLTKIEVRNVWTPAGVILGLVGLSSILKGRSNRIILFWLGTLGLFYLVTGKTTGYTWATYYHIVSVPSAALLIGLAMATPLRTISRVFAINNKPAASELASIYSVQTLALPIFFIGCFGAVLLFNARMIKQQIHPHKMVAQFNCARALKEKIPLGTLVVVSGASQSNEHGLPSAFNAPYMFFWMDRKGFSIGNAEQNLQKLEEFRKRGARYFVAMKRRLSAKPGFESELLTNFKLISECDETYLFELPPLRQGQK